MQNIWLIFSAVSIIMFLIYAIIDNFRIKLVKQEVKINNLPEEFKNYKILQMTDLHSKHFGKILYNKINKEDYDIIVFTGDMINNDDYEIKSLVKIIENINKKTPMLYVDGNNGPLTYDLKKGSVTEFGNKIKSLGITLLTDIYVVENQGKSIVFSNFDVSNKIFLKEKTNTNENFVNEFKMKKLEHQEGVQIGIGHYPVGYEALKKLDEKNNIIKINGNQYICRYDLVIAGHYHGGQIRIPFLGALFIPDNMEKIHVFPNQKYVCGLNTVGNTSQYISRGLGATGRIKMLKFRLFNTPNIDIITLKKL